MDNQVTIVDVKMPFMSMVVLLIKLAIAAIPAAIIIGVLSMLFAGLFAVLFGGEIQL